MATTPTPKNGYRIHDQSSAPEAAQPLLDQVAQGFGFVPNVLGVMAESPAALESYLTLNRILQDKGGFTGAELQVIQLVTSAENGCGYCVAAHTGNAERQGVDAATIAAIREGRALPEPRLDALASFTRTLLAKRGWAEEADVQALLDAGFTRQQVLDLVTVLAMKTISNWTNHLVDTPLDQPLQAKAWTERAA
jgi:uncharacterized peroxidase-related enzyme